LEHGLLTRGEWLHRRDFDSESDDSLAEDDDENIQYGPPTDGEPSYQVARCTIEKFIEMCESLLCFHAYYKTGKYWKVGEIKGLQICLINPLEQWWDKSWQLWTEVIRKTGTSKNFMKYYIYRIRFQSMGIYATQMRVLENVHWRGTLMFSLSQLSKEFGSMYVYGKLHIFSEGISKFNVRIWKRFLQWTLWDSCYMRQSIHLLLRWPSNLLQGK
jgi:hypothetical protein